MGYILLVTVKILLISSVFLCGNGQKNESQKIDFAKLKLNQQELFGSRWAMEQTSYIVIYHAVQIVDMVKVDVNDMSIRVDFHIRQRWKANGLEFPEGLFKDSDPNDTFVTAEENVLKSVFSPDSFIPNARETKILAVAAPQSAVNIYKDNTIIFKARMYAILGCSFTFQWYPLDIQVCDLVFESYRYSDAVVRYEWEPKTPVTADNGILLYQYDFFLPPMLEQGIHKRWAGKYKYPYVKMIFKFERKLGNNVIQIFIPTILVVVLSFFSFWLGLDAVPGRISLLITCILTLVTMHSGLKGVIPPVHYIKMMDIWMIGCMVFVFGAICEFIIVKYMKWRSMQIQAAKDEQEKYMQKNGLARPFPPSVHPSFQNGGVNKQPFSNAVYPQQQDYGQNITSIQNMRNFSQNELLSNSAQKRQAWHNAQVQQALEAHQGIDNPHGGYPGFVNVPGMPFYNNQQFVRPPPPPSGSRPMWVNIDRVFRILFPLLFAIFNAAYWPILLIGAAKQHENVQPNSF